MFRLLLKHCIDALMHAHVVYSARESSSSAVRLVVYVSLSLKTRHECKPVPKAIPDGRNIWFSLSKKLINCSGCWISSRRASCEAAQERDHVSRSGDPTHGSQMFSSAGSRRTCVLHVVCSGV